MTVDLFETSAPHPEASRLTAFAGNRLNRDAEHRTEESLSSALAAEKAALLIFAKGKLILKNEGASLRPVFLRSEADQFQPLWEDTILLGHRADGSPRLAVPARIEPDDVSAPFQATDARSAFRFALVDEETLGEMAQALSLMNWNDANRFCGKCGAPTVSRLGGYKRVCTACEHMLFPRTDPVVIMLTVDVKRDLVLLGRGPHFAPGMYSTLAGFVEPGETIEDAVRRETLEESGIRTGRVRYHASQPWPMPHSLMIGCYAEALSTEISRDEQELEDCRWFTRQEVAAMLEADPGAQGPSAPPRGAIAHRLMRDWVEWSR
ncbi:NAD(+) diphosphatase [Rhizobium oryzicola]|uniref:NAD(+) diphosphatase n=1 Tax=Rhizobium oryzicola TaxID=1232668 RepID=A0ABT8SQ46_9HYPH|nr:NAD(+) diphosphatase [Rhizobium oryzicola]MDO1580566.1 NAD(+) diphosphatase [Rhizobium oryzicola]